MGLPKNCRTWEHALVAFEKCPKVSVWDMGEFSWVRSLVDELQRRNYIAEDKEKSLYPWLVFQITDSGKEALKQINL